MAATPVYSPTTAPNPTSSCFAVPSEHLDKIRFVIKLFQVLLSFTAFILEEVVNSCVNCHALYFFEFVSCTAFLFTLLLLILLSTSLHSRVGITCWPCLDFLYTGVIAVLFLITSIVFASENSGTVVERGAVVFGFLATALFFADLCVYVKTKGFPFKRDRKAEPTNGGPPPANIPAEREKLNADVNGAE